MRSLSVQSRDIVMLSTADWDADLWTNKQHTARSLRDAGCRVLYVESMGLRPPGVGDIRRILRRLARVFRPPRVVEPGIWRWSPPSIPLQQYAAIRQLNRLLSSATLSAWSWRIFRHGRPIVWTYSPLTTALLRCRGRVVVYHCVDDIGAQPQMPRDLISTYERALVALALCVFVTSRELEQKWSRIREVTYLPNCVDADHFRPAKSARDPLAPIPHPRLGFVGAIATYKVDVALLTRICTENPTWHLVMIGPRERTDEDVGALLDLPNVHEVGIVQYGQLPAYMHKLDVGLIPALSNDYTRSMFPMKFFEYLAAGLPVVTTPLHSLLEYQHVASVVTPERFAEAITSTLAGEGAPLEQRLAAVARNTYAARTHTMLAELDTRLGSRSDPDSRHASSQGRREELGL
jgi:glycosyltransferase involved in cell wall biosynthesis